MLLKYRSLPLETISGEAVLIKPSRGEFTMISLDDSAIAVMTDFEEVSPITVRDITPIARALEYMIHSGVRSLFVLDNESRVIGLVTSYDIQGEKPIRYLHSIGCTHRNCSHEDVLVMDIMEPVDQLQDLLFDDVRRATVGNIVATFKKTGRKHLIVVDMNIGDGTPTIHGIFSATQLERQLSTSLAVAPIAHDFASIEQTVMNGRRD
ncbi:MAG: CBS domain-containing protein [Acidiferrobacterales bacterium]